MTMISYKNVLDKAIEAFSMDKDKALAWYITKQKQFGNLSPYEMCKNGKGKQVIKVLNLVIASNY